MAEVGRRRRRFRRGAETAPVDTGAGPGGDGDLTAPDRPHEPGPRGTLVPVDAAAGQVVFDDRAAADAGGLDPAPGDRRRTGPAVDDRDGERGLRGLVGPGSSQVDVGAALRARDAARPTDRHLAEAESNLTVIRRHWVPREDLPRSGR